MKMITIAAAMALAATPALAATQARASAEASYGASYDRTSVARASRGARDDLGAPPRRSGAPGPASG